MFADVDRRFVRDLLQPSGPRRQCRGALFRAHVLGRPDDVRREHVETRVGEHAALHGPEHGVNVAIARALAVGGLVGACRQREQRALAALFSTWLLQERVRPWAWAGMAVSLAGVGIIAFGEHGLSLGLGTVLLLGAAVAQSLYFVVQKPLLARYSAKEIVAYSFWLGPAVLAFTAGGLPDAGAHAPARATGVLLYLGVFPSFLGFICWSYVLARLPASHAASLLYLIPAVTIGIAYFWLHELPRPVALSGGGLCLLGVVVVNTLGRPAAKA